MLKPYQKQIVYLMIQQEILLAKLYSLFAEQFSDSATVWRELAEEEKKHATWLEQLYEAGEKGIYLFDEGKIKIVTLNNFTDYLREVITKAKNKELSFEQAVAYALDLEKSLIEKNIFNHFDSTSQQAQVVLNWLTRETEKHLAKVQSLQE
jgi:homoserine trans-succinylase